VSLDDFGRHRSVVYRAIDSFAAVAVVHCASANGRYRPKVRLAAPTSWPQRRKPELRIPWIRAACRNEPPPFVVQGIPLQETRMPRYLILSEAGDFPDDPTLVSRMMAFHDDMAKAGVLLDGAGLQPSSQGFRVLYDAAGQACVMNGPFAETKELIAGYTLIT
jgi:YCII-related domain